MFDEALGLWRGDVLCDLALEGDARAAAARLDDQRRAVQSERVDVALALGRHHELIPDLERAVVAEPLDERARGQLMLALYRDGRQADALARYREGRQTLVGQVGIEPGAELRALEQAILRHDPALVLPPESEAVAEIGGAPADSPPAARRRRQAATAALVLIAGLATIAAVAARTAPTTPVSVRGPRWRWSMRQTHASSARWSSARRRERSPTAPGRSGCRFPIPGLYRVSRPTRGG